ncbi:MAG: Gfo/Idh/MocA family oxidoreductase [Armatimonadetes bacterium]|nr:Gfo/Idh/MocA family oxidoreductase [Armatimonadota bacterium]MDW8120940.1 Gfo/Idh/MocA family oxidoreductase [Armatimonadota bacterium]
MKKEISRRQFLKWTGLMTFVGSTTTVGSSSPAGEPVGVAFIGTGEWGRTLLGYLIKVPGFEVIALCDVYEPHLKKALEIVGKPVAAHSDYRKVLEDGKVKAVIIATPPHTHREIVSAALQAGKHIWCEVPLAHNEEETRGLAREVVEAKTVFQCGLQRRYNPTIIQAYKFHRAGTLGRLVLWSGRWHRKDSWRRIGRDPESEKALNWRLDPELSGGLITEVLLHHFDLAGHFIGSPPQQVHCQKSLVLWEDGREMPDTVTCLLTYPDQVQADFQATLANSFQGVWDIVAGEFGAFFFQGFKGLLFREADARPLGWEVYAKRERLAREEGYLIVADATKLLEQGKMPGELGVTETLENHEIYQALKGFQESVRSGTRPKADIIKGLEATIVALKAAQAARSQTPVTIKATDFQI